MIVFLHATVSVKSQPVRQVQKAYYTVLIFLTYWLLENGEGFLGGREDWGFSPFFSLMELLGTDSLGVL